MQNFLPRFLRWLGLAAAALVVVVIGFAGFWIYTLMRDLPSVETLQDYAPPITTRVYAGNGTVLGEFAHERRIFVPAAFIPKLVKQAFTSAEDRNFYSHPGIDPSGILRAAIKDVGLVLEGRRPQGASTITQQVAKNFLLTNEVSFTRKIKEALLAMRIERAYSKDKILELYLNEIYLGLGNYGVAASALGYFDKSVHELSIAEVAYLAALPKEPSALNPFRNHDRAVERRNYVIGRMAEDGYITAEQAKAARAEPLVVTPRALTPNSIAAGFFAEEVRRELSERYGEQKLYEGGLSVRTTLDPKLQLMARKALVDGLVRYDEAHGWHGTVKTVD
jgi:penicillin-binding protein 1A